MKFHGGNQLLQMHGGHFTIIELWFGRRVFGINYYPQHTFHFWCHSNGAVKGKDNCLDLNLHILGFFFSYTDYGYSRYKTENQNGK